MAEAPIDQDCNYDVRIGPECGQPDIDGTEVGSRLGVVVDPMDSNHIVAAEHPR